jgi:hypothetical protein
MKDLEELYAQETLKAVLAEFADDFSSAGPGTCMKLAGLPLEGLKALRAEVMRTYPHLETFILTDGSFSDEGTVSATKLIELRNAGEAPLLALLPSALQTPAEDSYGNATFRELPMARIGERLVGDLEREMPDGIAPLVKAVFAFTPEASVEERAKYLLAVRKDGWQMGAVGENLNVLGLVPDTSADADVSRWRTRLFWNRKCAETLCDFQSFVPDRVTKLPIRPDTNQKEIVEFLMDCTAKSRHGVMDAMKAADMFSSALDFAVWQIVGLEGAAGRTVKIAAGALSSPHIKNRNGDKSLTLKDGQVASVKIRLTVTPPPKDCPELKMFRLALVSTDSGEEVKDVRRVEVKPGTRTYRDVNIKVSSSFFEEGTYYFRVYGEDEAGNILNQDDDFRDIAVHDAWLAELRRNTSADHSAFKERTGGKTVNETEDIDIRFTPEGTDDAGDDDGSDEKKPRQARIDAAYQGYLRYRIGRLKRAGKLDFPSLGPDASGWEQEGTDSLQKTFFLSLDVLDNYRIGIPGKLYRAERELLLNGSMFGSVVCRTHANPNHAVFDNLAFVQCAEPRLAGILQKRERLFALIRASAKGDSGVFETWLDFCKPENLQIVREYVAAYKEAIAEALDDIRSGSGGEEGTGRLIALQTLDTICIESPTDGGGVCSVRLMPPIHPLRLAWFVNLVELYGEWEAKSVQDKSRIHDWDARAVGLFLGDLHPSSNPTVIAETASRYASYAGEIAFGWGVWIRQEDGGALSAERATKTRMAEQLNVPFDARVDTDLSVEMIVRHLISYLKQHPYADRLVANVFNPGDGTAFVKALVELEKRFPGERTYEFRLFGGDGRFGQGRAFRELMNPESMVSGEAEAFSEEATNKLFPKLRFSVNGLSAFHSDPHGYTANMSFLVNPFVSSVLLVPPDRDRPSDSLNGLVVRDATVFSNKDGELAWCRSKWCREVAGDGQRFFLDANALFNRWQAVTAAVMSPGAVDLVPGASVAVGAEGKALVSQIHASSDWVVTFDKSIGPEMFDSGNAGSDSPYLLDYVPGGEFSGLSSFLTSRPGIEAYRFLDPYLDKVGLGILKQRENMLRILEDIRAVSGSLLMQALATDNKAFEVIGLALTKRMLEKKGYLHNAFLVPIDLHADIFGNAGDSSRERADLLLVSMSPKKREIHFDVIEVKCRTDLKSEAVEMLENKVLGQIEHSIRAFREHFELPDDCTGADRIDRAAKNIELRNLFEFYIERAARFGMMDDMARRQLLDFCATLDEGYSLSFSPLEVIYNFSARHGHMKETDGDITRYTIGKQLIGQIMDAESDLDTLRLEETLRRLELVPFPTVANAAGKPDVSSRNGGTDESRELPPTEQEVAASSPQIISEAPAIAPPAYDTLVGGNAPSEQYGLLGIQKANGRRIALDLSGTSTISLFGVQGAGKSYTIGTVTEMALKSIPCVNALPAPLAGVIFHYSESMDYTPEFTSMNRPNDNPADIDRLLTRYDAEPTAIDDIVLLVPKAKVEERKLQYPQIEVRPIAFKSSELSVKDWQFLLGAVGNDSIYIRQINSIMRKLRNNLSFNGLRLEVRNSTSLSNAQKTLAEQRFQFAQEYIDDTTELGAVLSPGRLVIVDLRDEFIQKDEALGLFVVMLNIFSSVGCQAENRFNKFIVFDEAHKYMDNRDLTGNIVTAIREMRHKGVSLLLASQDPPSLPSEIIELSSIVLMHRFNSPEWLKHIRKSVTSLAHLRPTDMVALAPGEAYLWAGKSTDRQIETAPIKITTRPRVTKHGGGTLTAV